jgi:hypothetical protein
MLNYKWQKEAISKHMVLVRAARRSGKTYAAVQWARKAGKRVLYVVPFSGMVESVINSFVNLYPMGLHTVQKNRGYIAWADGTEIDVIAQSEHAVRGRRIDAVVLDEAGYIDDKFLVRVLMCCTADKLFAVYTVDKTKSVKLIQEMPMVEHMSVDYLDMIEQGIFTAADIRQYKDYVTHEVFEAEFGPFPRTDKQGTNKYYKYLLDGALWV